MGVFVLQTGIARGIDQRIARLEKIIDTNASRVVEIDARGLEIQAVDIRHPTCAREDGIDLDRALVIVTHQIDELLSALYAHVNGSSVKPDLDAITREGIR